MYLGLTSSHELSGKRVPIVFWGSGMVYQKFCEMINLDNYIIGVVDNNTARWGRRILYHGRSLEIMSPQEAIRRGGRNAEWILTTGVNATMEILLQLSNIAELKDTVCYTAYSIMAGYSYEGHKIPSTFRLEEKQIIPHIIHYCWFGGRPLPELYQNCIDSWSKNCPGWEIRRWDENNYDISKHHYMKQAAEQGCWAFVSDYARKDVVYQYGGIYLDADVEVLRPLDELCHQKGFCAFVRNQIATGLGFGGQAHNSIIKEWMDAYDTESFVMKKRTEMKVCMDYETEILERHGLIRNGDLQYLQGMTVYPGELFIDEGVCCGYEYVSDKTFIIHRNGGSWFGERKGAMRALARLHARLHESSFIYLDGDSLTQ